MTCTELLTSLCDYLGDELVVEVRESLELHLTACEHCAVYVETYRHTILLSRKMRCGPLPAALEARLREELRDDLHSGE
jgi:anti-sigma factor RsiW